MSALTSLDWLDRGHFWILDGTPSQPFESLGPTWLPFLPASCQAVNEFRNKERDEALAINMANTALNNL